MDKEDVAHIYNGILLSHKKKRNEVFVVMWMELESVIQSEVSQKEKNKYSMVTCYLLEEQLGLQSMGLQTGHLSRKIIND